MSKPIQRWEGKYTGRNRAVAYDGYVYTVGSNNDPEADVQEQTRRSLDAIEKNLIEGGSGKDRMLSVQVFMADISQKALMDEVWVDWIGDDPNTWPQRACVGAPLAPNTLVEIVVKAAQK